MVIRYYYLLQKGLIKPTKTLTFEAKTVAYRLQLSRFSLDRDLMVTGAQRLHPKNEGITKT